MKNYTLHFLILTAVTALLGFSGLDLIGGMLIRIICLISGIGLILSCLDSVLLSRRQKRALQQQPEPIREKSNNDQPLDK
ncbi:hypothetical protein MG296_00390 [Flavobacteriaceae bacterium TK19130]|nr:hypothetical protein [Thermobacterium salinum]